MSYKSLLKRLSLLVLLPLCTGCKSQSAPLPPVSTEPAQTASVSAGGVARLIQLNSRQEQLANIRTVKAADEPITDKLDLSSAVESTASGTGTVYSPVNGIISRILADVSDQVHRGQIMAYVNSPDLSDAQSAYLHSQAKLIEARAQIGLTETRKDLAISNQDRLTGLKKEGIASQREVEIARSQEASTDAELVAAKANQAAALAELNASKVKLDSLGLKVPTGKTSDVTSQLAIRSPVDGVITQRNVNPGQMVGLSVSSNGSKAAALFTVADLRRVWVMLEVPQSEISRLQLGAKVEFSSEVAPGKKFIGIVTRLGENFDPASRCASVRTEIDNSNGILKPGMMVIATVRGRRPGSAQITIPDKSLQRINNKNCIFIALPDHKYELREMTCGERLEGKVIIKSGLKPHEPVVSDGSFFLKSEAVKSSMGGGD